MEKEDLGVEIVEAAACGQITDPEEFVAMFAVLGGASIVRPTASPEATAAGMGVIVYTLDANGEVLVAGKNYITPRGEKIKVLREVFGSGNLVDTWQWVYYLDSTLEENFLVVPGSFTRGIFNGQTYRSQLIPADSVRTE